MGKVDIEEELRKDNRSARSVDLQVFANALRLYYEATQNVKKNGAICSHPRTGTPIFNPYLKIQAQQGAILSKMERVRSDRVVGLLQKAMENG